MAKKLYDPTSTKPFELSRYKIDLFCKCPRCFWLNRRHGVEPPDFPAYTLNSAVDSLLKKEFDICRRKVEPHRVMREAGIKAVPFRHPDLETWRRTFTGARFLHKPTNMLIFGAVDDLWVSEPETLHIVDYKASAQKEAPTLDAPKMAGFKRQLEIYQWLYRQLGFTVSKTAYLLACNGRMDRRGFYGRLEFDMKILAYQGDPSWVEPTILEIKKILASDAPPASAKDCGLCDYRVRAAALEAKA